MPSVEDQDVDAQPGGTGLDGVELEDASDGFAHDVHQIGGVVEHHRHAIVLQATSHRVSGGRAHLFVVSSRSCACFAD
ncbi:hypothetical protein MUK42_07738 [Musa troglodytarum]|uniref:Uncharacterized protein n=1 Tax=Musa troglodytarum TaxID=320322 RepID=A0A9E7EC24_9LILI|nr:hypothetical protein MUK42_07738 [Musa troglodytarum]